MNKPAGNTSLSAHEKQIRQFIDKMSPVPGFEKVRFIIHYGSTRRATDLPHSDIDLCLYFDGDNQEASHFRHTVLSLPGAARFDVQIFRQLPLYVRMEVLKGQVVFAPDMRFVYDTAVSSIREYDDFRHRLDDYTGEVAIS
jgi:predicted nucleotidyltransferase